MHKLKILYYTLKEISLLQIIFKLKYFFKRKLIEKFGSIFFFKYERNFENQDLYIKKNPLLY